MKSTADTLKFVTSIIDEIKKTFDIEIALIGGLAVIAHGVGRSTLDIDFLIHANGFRERASEFLELLTHAVPSCFEIRKVDGSKMMDDPFPYDIIFLTDRTGEYPRMDFIFPKYKWELEGLRMAKPVPGVSFPVLSIPYLIAMKLRAGGPNDHSDVIQLFNLLSPEEKVQTKQLAVSVRRDKKLAELLSARRMVQTEPEDGDQLL